MDHSRVKAQIDAELDSESILVGCYLHMYFGPSKSGTARPTSGCTDCWKAYWVHDLASVTPDKRAERLAEAYEVLMNLNRAVETGKFDFTPYRRAQVTHEKDALPS